MKRFLGPALAGIVLLQIQVLAHAQLTNPSDISKGLPKQAKEELVRERASLVLRGNTLRGKIEAQNRNCSSVREDSPDVDPCRQNQAFLLNEIQQYNTAVDDFNRKVEHLVGEWSETVKSCEAFAHQAAMDREEIEREMRTNRLSQEELAEWNRLNAKSQTEAVKASIKFVVGEYVEGMSSVQRSATRLEATAAAITEKAINSKKYADRVRYLAQLQDIISRLTPVEMDLLARTIAAKGIDAEKTWSLARDTFHHEVRVAEQGNEQLRAALTNSRFKEAFTGDPDDDPGMDVVMTLSDQAVEESGKFLAKLTRYEKFTGQAVRAAEFVRDASYCALLSYFSTERVLQESDLARSLAVASKVLQKRYKRTVDTLVACRRDGLG